MMDGAARFMRKMALIPKDVIAAVRAAMEEGAEEIVALMKRLAPRDRGELVNSIGWTWGSAPKGAVAISTVGDGGAGVGVITIYAGGGSAFHAVFQEFGTKNMTANPFFYPAYRALRSRVRSRITRAMKKAVRNAGN